MKEYRICKQTVRDECSKTMIYAVKIHSLTRTPIDEANRSKTRKKKNTPDNVVQIARHFSKTICPVREIKVRESCLTRFSCVTRETCGRRVYQSLSHDGYLRGG